MQIVITDHFIPTLDPEKCPQTFTFDRVDTETVAAAAQYHWNKGQLVGKFHGRLAADKVTEALGLPEASSWTRPCSHTATKTPFYIVRFDRDGPVFFAVSLLTWD